MRHHRPPPTIVTGRFGYDRRPHARRLRRAPAATTALRKAARRWRPPTVGDEVKTASLLGRGGAGFPAGVKWAFCPPGVWPRYLVVNGDESEPGTYKDRILMERDPHQLIEGVLIAATRSARRQAFLYVRGEMALAQERIAAGPQRGLRRRLRRPEHPRLRLLLDIVLHWGAGAYIVGEETALIESLEGDRGMPRLKPPFFPAAKGLYMQPTIVNNVETLSNLPWIITNGGEAFAALGAETSPRHAHLRRVGPRRNARRVTRSSSASPPSATCIDGPVYGGGIRDGNADQGLHPRRRARPRGSSRSTSTCRSRRAPSTGPARCSAPARSSSWTRPPTPCGPPGGSCGSSPTSPAASARRAVRARPGSRRSSAASSTATAAPSDLDLLLDVCDNIAPGLDLAAPSRPPSARSARRPRVADRVGPRAASATSSRPASPRPTAVPVDQRVARRRPKAARGRGCLSVRGPAPTDGVTVTINGTEIVRPARASC